MNEALTLLLEKLEQLKQQLGVCAYCEAQGACADDCAIATLRSSGEPELECQFCHRTNSFVSDVEDPWARAMRGLSVVIRVCDDCYSDRVMSV